MMLNRFRLFTTVHSDYQKIPSDDLEVRIQIKDNSIIQSDKEKPPVVSLEKISSDIDISSTNLVGLTLKSIKNNFSEKLTLIWEKINTRRCINGYYLKDYLSPDEIIFLKQYHLNAYTDISSAKKIIKVIREIITYNQILLPNCWKIVRDYLAPFSIKELIKKTTHQANDILMNIKKMPSTTITKIAQIDEEEAELSMERFETLRLIYKTQIDKNEDVIKKKTLKISTIQSLESQLHYIKCEFYSLLSLQVEQAQVLDQKSVLYCKIAENRLKNTDQSGKNSIASAKRKDANDTYIITKAIKFRIHIFAKTSLIYSCNVLNKAGEIDKNEDCLKVLNFMTKAQTRGA